MAELLSFVPSRLWEWGKRNAPTSQWLELSRHGLCDFSDTADCTVNPRLFLEVQKRMGTSKLVVGTQVSPPKKLLGVSRGGPSVGQALLEDQRRLGLSFPSPVPCTVHLLILQFGFPPLKSPFLGSWES